MYTHNSLNNFENMNPVSIKNEAIDEILRGETSAIEAYEQIMEKITDDPEVHRLEQFKQDHVNAVQYWKREARISGNIPAQDSSIWGTVVEAIVGTSKLIGEETALRALRKGEEHGLSNYEKMLSSDQLSRSQKEEIRKTFIPRQKQHMEGISALIKMQ